MHVAWSNARHRNYVFTVSNHEKLQRSHWRTFPQSTTGTVYTVVCFYSEYHDTKRNRILAKKAPFPGLNQHQSNAKSQIPFPLWIRVYTHTDNCFAVCTFQAPRVREKKVSYGLMNAGPFSPWSFFFFSQAFAGSLFTIHAGLLFFQLMFMCVWMCVAQNYAPKCNSSFKSLFYCWQKPICQHCFLMIF